MKRNLGLFVALFFLGSLMQLLAESYQYFDGNANQYLLTNKDSKINLNYIPITKEMSSSGFYSGGDPQSVNLSKTQFTELTGFLIQMSKQGKPLPKGKSNARRKGTGLLIHQKGKSSKKWEFSFLSKDGSKIETYLKDALQRGITNPMPIQLQQTEYFISRGDSPWNGLTSTFEGEEKGKLIPAQDASTLSNESQFTALLLPKEIVLNEKPILFLDNVAKRIVVDESMFSSLNRIDVTRLNSQEKNKVGSAFMLQTKDPNFLIPFLIQGQILKTYIHTDAHLHFQKFLEQGDNQCFAFEGEHHYYTNTKNTGKIKFQICLDKISGDIYVLGD